MGDEKAGLKKAFDVGVGTGTEARLGRLLAYAQKEGMRWRCLGPCSELLSGDRPADGWCNTCRSRRAQGSLGTREESLARVGVPKKARNGFVEPGSPGCFQPEWPKAETGRGVGRSLADWRPGVWWCALIHGTTGSGKTMLAAELLWRAMNEKKARARWVRASAIASAVLSGGDVEQLHGSHVVVVDELGVGHDASPAWSAVEDFVCRRWEEDEPTLVTTNLTGEVLRAKSAPMFDRLLDGLVCRVHGESHRGKR